MKTGILGGTFNPIHLAHLRIAEEVREACALDEVLFIPAASPPHKAVAGDIQFAHRLAMVAAAIADNPAFRVSDLEARRSGKSFSVDTLELLRHGDPAGERYFIVGLDSFRDIATWKEFVRLFELAHLVVTARPGVELPDPLTALPVAVQGDFCYDNQLKKLRHRSGNTVIFLEETRLDISSTLIRGKVAAGESIRYLVPPAVAAYIDDHGLYRNTAGS
jgi:nicotinate-nucleotide adenylyltransferase